MTVETENLVYEFISCIVLMPFHFSHHVYSCCWYSLCNIMKYLVDSLGDVSGVVSPIQTYRH